MKEISLNNLLILLLISFSFLSFLSLSFPFLLKYFILIPANLLILNSFFWILFSSSFLEISLSKIFYTFFFLLFFYFKNFFISFNIKNFFLYFFLNIFFSSSLSLFWLFYKFYLTNSEEFLLDSIYGTGTLLMSLTMILRQQYTNQSILSSSSSSSSSSASSTFSYLSSSLSWITFNYLPTILLFYNTILWILGIHFLTVDISFYWISYFFSWIYLRFYYHYPVIHSVVEDLILSLFYHSLITLFPFFFFFLERYNW